MKGNIEEEKSTEFEFVKWKKKHAFIKYIKSKLLNGVPSFAILANF